MDSPNAERLRELMEEAEERGLIDNWLEEGGSVVLYAGSVTYAVELNRATSLLEELIAAHDRMQSQVSKDRPRD